MSDYEKIIKELEEQKESFLHRLNSIEKAIDDILWNQRLGKISDIEKYRITGPPPKTYRTPQHKEQTTQ